MARRNIIRWGPQQQQPKWISELGLWESLSPALALAKVLASSRHISRSHFSQCICCAETAPGGLGSAARVRVTSMMVCELEPD
ncbi:hypothetical protein ACLKA6_014514 [Drosophila palustris]